MGFATLRVSPPHLCLSRLNTHNIFLGIFLATSLFSWVTHTSSNKPNSSSKHIFLHSLPRIICLPCKRPWFDSSVGKIPWRRKKATRSSILAWRIPWTEEPGELQSMGSQRVRHDWAINTYTQSHVEWEERLTYPMSLNEHWKPHLRWKWNGHHWSPFGEVKALSNERSCRLPIWSFGGQNNSQSLSPVIIFV